MAIKELIKLGPCPRSWSKSFFMDESGAKHIWEVLVKGNAELNAIDEIPLDNEFRKSSRQVELLAMIHAYHVHCKHARKARCTIEEGE